MKHICVYIYIHMKPYFMLARTVMEAKSGYGLDFDNELKMLRVLTRAAEGMHVHELASSGKLIGFLIPRFRVCVCVCVCVFLLFCIVYPFSNSLAAHPIEISPTYCGAHAVPQGATATEAANKLISAHLPAILTAKDQGMVCLKK